MLRSEQEPEILEVTPSHAPAAPPNVIGSKNEVFKKESLNHSTSSQGLLISEVIKNWVKGSWFFLPLNPLYHHHHQ
jgi:hypothetical protein